MTASPDILFKPFTLKGLTLPNRIVMAPMTRNFSPGGVPDAAVAAYYRRRAEDGVGLILTEGTVVGHPGSTNSARVPRFYGADALAGWAKVLAAVHAAGGRIMPQLWHVGSVRKLGDPPDPSVPPSSPSGLAKAGRVIGEPMTEADIAAAIEAFAQGAADAQRLGFDGIEIHGAHGYLIDQFFWAETNQRTDRYGGDLVARTRFAAEIVAACRRRTGPDFPILLRFSQWKQQDYEARLVTTPDELARFLEPLVDAGVDLFHCSTRRFWEPEFPGSDLNLAGWTKKLSGKPAMTVGSVSLNEEFIATFQGASAGSVGIELLLQMLARGDFDLVAVGRALLVDPAWTSKVRARRFEDLRPFTPEALKELV